MIFAQTEEFKNWVEANVTSTKYECYITDENEILLVPRRSTRPVKYAYYKASSKEEGESIKKGLEAMGLNIFRVKEVEWAEDRAIGLEKKMVEE